MNTFQLSWKNLRYKPLSTLLILVLFSLGVGLISLLLLIENQLRENFEKNLAGVNLVIGAKGSPLQLILSSMYHIDAPTGNITLKEARPFLNPKHPFIDQAIPISLGDNHKGYRLVGTSQDILKLYKAQVASGKVWERNFEVNIGANVAKELNMKIGDEFKSSHGFVDDVDMKHDHAQAFKVVGILAPTGSVIDQLLLTSTQSFWLVHEHGEEEHHEDEGEEDHEHDADHDHDTDKGHSEEDHEKDKHSEQEQDDHDHKAGEHEEHDHEGDDYDHEAALNAIPKPIFAENDSAEITSLLIKFKAINFQTLNMQRNINENTDLQAATPAIEIARLYTLMGTGEQVLRLLAAVIIFVAGLSIFISLYSSLKERKYELALMRVMGAAQKKLFFLLITEGILLALMGFVIGTILSHLGMQLLASFMKDAYRYSFTAFQFLPQEWFLLIGALLFGFIAAVIPAVQASRTDISETLTKG